MLLTPKQAAIKLNVSASMVYSLCSARKLRHVRIGLARGKILIPEDAIDEYLQGRTVQAQEGNDEDLPLRHIVLPSAKPA